MAYTVATGYVATSILLSGFYLRISAIKYAVIRGLSWASYTKYAMQAMGRIELLGRMWGPDTCTQGQGMSPRILLSACFQDKTPGQPFCFVSMDLSCFCLCVQSALCFLSKSDSPNDLAVSADPIIGARTSDCVTKGQDMLDYYGYTINTGVLVAALIAAYFILHIGSYLALSRLHRPR